MTPNFKKIIPIFILVISFFLAHSSYAIEIAITVDDLPAHGELPPNTTRLEIEKIMLDTFKKHPIKNVYGFINGEKIKKDNEVLLQEWVRDGNFLGNHTFSHLDLAKVSADQFIRDIKNNENDLRKLMNKKNYKYFRYPYLSEGNTQEKRNQVRAFLFENHYQIAPVTVDFF